MYTYVNFAIQASARYFTLSSQQYYSIAPGSLYEFKVISSSSITAQLLAYQLLFVYTIKKYIFSVLDMGLVKDADSADISSFPSLGSGGAPPFQSSSQYIYLCYFYFFSASARPLHFRANSSTT